MSYSAKDIEILEGLEAVRLRPGMYIGSTDKSGLHHLLWEILDNSIDEAMNGYAKNIRVTLHEDGCSVTVTDDGRGIPVDEHPVAHESVLQVILTKLHAGGKFNQNNYKTSGGLHGVGSSVVNALSSEFRVRVQRDGGIFEQTYSKGNPLRKVKRVGSSRLTGTEIFFRPDEEIFGDIRFDTDIIRERIETKAYLIRGLHLIYEDQTTQTTSDFCFEGGLADYVQEMIQNAQVVSLHADLFTTRKYIEETGESIEVALCWCDRARECIKSFVNAIPTPDGGSHEQALRDGVQRALRAYMETHDLLPKNITLTAEDTREGLYAAISLFMANPQFQGQTKGRLGNQEIKTWISNHIKNELETFFNTHPKAGQAVAANVILAARARIASRQAALNITHAPKTSRKLNLPGKLADCSSNNPEECELFIVEGDSAGGSAKQGRDRNTQAILPLRGKVCNAERASLQKVAGYTEFCDIANALGCSPGKDCNTSRLRYNKVILLMDADSDGYHISTLLLTYFYRYLRPLIDEGHVYIAQPPLYRIEIGKNSFWVLDDKERDRILKKYKKSIDDVQLTRFKGLGEMMPQTLYETTLNPRTRRLLKVEIQPGCEAETDTVLSELMGDDPKPRFRLITEHASEVNELDL